MDIVPHAAFDLDGTLIVQKYPEFGELIEKNVQLLNDIKDEGYKIAILTARIYEDKEMEEKTKQMFWESRIKVVYY